MRKYVTVFPSNSEVSKTRRSMEFSSPASRFISKISPEEFVRAWLSSKTLEEVAKKTGMTYAAVGTRARKYLKQGVELPRLEKRASGRGGIPRLDIQGLNELIELATTKKE